MRGRSSSRLFVFGAVIILLAALSPTLVGCQGFIGHLMGEDLVLNNEGEQELQRFRSVYNEYSSDGWNEQNFDHFTNAFQIVRGTYVRPMTDKALIDSAITGVKELEGEIGSFKSDQVVEAALDKMVASLDPHSSYLNPQEFADTNASTRGEFGGLGIQVTMHDKVIKVISPIEDTPAFRAGVLAGDLIIGIDQKPVQGMTLRDAVQKMRGKPGTKISLLIKREGEKPFVVRIIRAVIRIKPVRYHREGAIGYIRVTSFSRKVETGVEEAMDKMKNDPKGGPLTGVVLDLRSNPGGLLDQSLALSDAFLEKGEIVSIKGRNAQRNRSFKAGGGDLAQGLPMVVLIDGGSASASEIVASALQENGRATVMGVQSFGKGSVQTITPLAMKGALRLTTSLYYAPSGLTIQARGVDPDIRITPKPKDGEDPAKVKRHSEADYDNALPGSEKAIKHTRLTIKDEQCPPVGEKEKQDRVLGCALEFLKAGSTKGFVVALGNQS